MLNLLRTSLLGLMVLSPARATPPASTGLPNLVLEIAVDSLGDIATAIYTPGRGIIYYNPERQRRIGPELTAFFRAHEFGHLYFHHTRAAAADGGHARLSSTQLRARELEADCYAAKRLAPSHRAAIVAAVQFFRHAGSVPLDDEHPDGPARAARIERCAGLDLNREVRAVSTYHQPAGD